MTHEVFISYSTEDKPVADAVVAGLEQQNIRCWIAPRDLLPGIPWSEGITNAINKCKLLVVILSEKSNVSKNVLREINLAVNNDLIVIPFRIENIDPSGAISFFISSEHWLDAVSPPLQRHIDKLCNVIQLLLPKNIQPQQSTVDNEEVLSNIEEHKNSINKETKRSPKIKVWLGLMAGLILSSLLFIILVRKLDIFPKPKETPFIPSQTTINVENTSFPINTPEQTQAISSLLQITSTQEQSTTEPVMLENGLGIGSTFINLVDDSEFVYVPAGYFLMGNEEGNNLSDEGPAVTVFLDAFWIQKYEVTNAQYLKCIQADYCDGHERDYPQNNSPAVSVDWYDALLYCNWIGGSLPTEAQWEKAARGTDGRLYPWGNELPNDRLVNFNESNKGPRPVGSYPLGTSPYGVEDMAGNVWEWVMDWYDSNAYSKIVYENPTGPDDGLFRVIRGGSWYTGARSIRVVNRYRQYPHFSDISYGFRCSMD